MAVGPSGETSIDVANTFWDSLGRPRLILGPMVDQSDLAFRLLTRRYGTELCYTPMLHSRLFVEQESYRSEKFNTSIDDVPIIAQFCGDDHRIVTEAALIVSKLSSNVKAIDLNFGCPQVSVTREGSDFCFSLKGNKVGVANTGTQSVEFICRISCFGIKTLRNLMAAARRAPLSLLVSA